MLFSDNKQTKYKQTMKRLLLLITAIMSFSGLFAEGQWVGINTDEPAAVSKELVTSNVENSVVHFTLDGFTKKPVQTPRGQQYVITAEGATPILKKGAPDVSKMTASVIIPDMEKGELNRIMVIGTGALLSPLTVQQGESIPGIAHAIVIERAK